LEVRQSDESVMDCNPSFKLDLLLI
jgi:hypothetical protein